MLAIYVGPHLRRLILEMEKLRCYADGRSITANDVQLLVSDTSGSAHLGSDRRNRPT